MRCLFTASFSDPHFETFNGQAFSFHGECDLVMMQSSTFAAGLGLDLHIGTTRVDLDRVSYSYISAAALRVDSDVLEVKDDGSVSIDCSLVLALITSKDTKENICNYDLFL